MLNKEQRQSWWSSKLTDYIKVVPFILESGHLSSAITVCLTISVHSSTTFSRVRYIKDLNQLFNWNLYLTHRNDQQVYNEIYRSHKQIIFSTQVLIKLETVFVKLTHNKWCSITGLFHSVRRQWIGWTKMSLI